MSNRLLTALCVGVFACSLPAGGALAAVTVIGSGSAQLCFQAADSGRSQREGIGYCNDALVGPLTKDDHGIWRGTASQDGKPVELAVDFNGNVVPQATR